MYDKDKYYNTEVFPVDKNWLIHVRKALTCKLNHNEIKQIISQIDLRLKSRVVELKTKEENGKLKPLITE